MGEDVADAYRHWALPFFAGGVGPYDRPKVSPTTPSMPDRDLVVVADGGYAKREFLRHCQSMSKPIVVVTKLRKDASRYQPAPARRPGRSGGPGWSAPTAQSHGGAGRSRYPMDPLPRHRSDGSTAMVELFGLALWYHGGRVFPYVVVIRYLEERRGPYALHAPTPRRNPCGYCSGICCGGRSR